MKSRSEPPSGVGFDDFAKFVHIFSSLVLTEIRLSFMFIFTFIRMKKNYQSTFKIIFRPALSQGKLFHVENQRELVTMANLQTRKPINVTVYLSFWEPCHFACPSAHPIWRDCSLFPCKTSTNWSRLGTEECDCEKNMKETQFFPNLQRSFGILGIMTSRRVAGGQ